MKVVGALGAAIAATLVLSGCDKAAEGQTLAVVNGEEISSSELNAELAAANLPPTADKKTVMPQLLQRLVDRRLMAQLAEEQGITRTPQFLAQERRLREELLIRLLGERQAQSTKAPDQQAIDKFIAENPGMFQNRLRYSLDQLVFEQPADPTLLNALKDDRTLGEVEQTLTSLGIAFTRNKSVLDTATIPAQLLRQLQALPAGEPFIIPQGGRIVASVITGQEAIPMSAEQNRPIAAELIRRRQITEAVQKQLEAERKEAEIEYQEGYAPKGKGNTPEPAKKSG